MSAPEQSAAASDEVQLVERARAGDLEAFEELLGRHQQRVMRVVLSILKEPMDAEEVAQDVFLTVFEKIDHFRGDSSFSTWLHRVAVNAALMRRRKSKADRSVPLDDVMPSFDERGHLAVDIADWSQQAGDPVLAREAGEVIEAAVEKLDEMYRTVFALRDVQGFSTEETAEILELSVPAVKSRLHRARLFLRRELAEYFEKRV
ncbi:sigma-70 family RNA polymerase sigma factor [bacterium]|nr:RNA polymerase subunit sigma [Gemmatimonadota bacterium]MCH2660573.1 sigma-70 family RNA polymerase sigma factor [bacterium]|tara:strand:+ start:366 stop:977 length:612 start_codon:yes stop_codon:yes gene_type:complete